jgi:L-serine dehydratase
MESLRQLYRIGTGPSSSHTMAPRQAALMFLDRYPDVSHCRVTLFGSLAATGRGHLTDKTLYDVFNARGVELELMWVPEEQLPLHPNGMRFEALTDFGLMLHSWEVYSVGGGALQDSDKLVIPPAIYPLTNMADILKFLDRSGESFWEYVLNYEDSDFLDFLDSVRPEIPDFHVGFTSSLLKKICFQTFCPTIT